MFILLETGNTTVEVADGMLVAVGSDGHDKLAAGITAFRKTEICTVSASICLACSATKAFSCSTSWLAAAGGAERAASAARSSAISASFAARIVACSSDLTLVC